MKEISRFFEFLGMEKVGIIGGNGLNEPGAVLKRTDLLKKAEEIGEKFLG